MRNILSMLRSDVLYSYFCDTGTAYEQQPVQKIHIGSVYTYKDTKTKSQLFLC